MPPADDGPAERDMLHLDDELAGLVEAADMPADQHGTHAMKPGPPPSVPGKIYDQSESAAALSAMCCAVLCCTVSLQNS